MSVHTAKTDKFTKHVGVYNDKRIAIILQLPEEPGMVHVIETDALPDQYHEGLINIINTPEAQASRWLGEVLHRRPLADGSNALRTFYERGLIYKVPASHVTLTPYPNKHVPLTDVLAQFADPLADAQTSQESNFDEIVAGEQRKLNESVELKHNQHMENFASDKVDQNRAIAGNLIVEAELLEVEAQRKRAQAAQLVEAKKKDNVTVSETGPFVDLETGKKYKSAAALKGVMTKRDRKRQNDAVVDAVYN